MMSGKSIAGVIGLATMPFIARLFSASDFGIAALFLSLGVIVSNVGALRYEVALVLPKEDSEAMLMLALTYRILFAVCLTLLLLVAAYELNPFTAPVLESLGTWLWFLPLGVLLLGILQVQEHWLSRKRRFNIVAASMVLGTSVVGGTRIGFGYVTGSSIFGLIVGQMLGQVSRLFFQKEASADGIRATFRRIKWSELRSVAAKYADFPKLNAPAGLMTTATQQLPVVLLGVLFSPAIVGFYAMAVRLTHTPITIVTNSVRRVFMQKAAEIKNQGRSLVFAYLTTTGTLAIMGSVPLTVLWFFGQPLAILLLGDEWTEAGRYLEIISPWLFALWVTAPANPIFVVLRKQKLWLGMQFGATVVRLSMFGLSYFVGAGPEWTLQAFVIATLVGHLIIILTATLLVKQHGASLIGTAMA
jgi:O-antigen/teichoic acid export membrane protein